ncbi:MAG: sensor histidine kinase [Candidatus Electrothrix sp. LOE2]|nr:sensor histidine kinase [Candidatus Electrothrix sp. LOE2]
MHGAWKGQLKSIAKTLQRQELFQEILSSIDERIINEGNLGETIQFTADKILQLSLAKGLRFVFDESIISFGDKSDGLEIIDILIANNKKLPIYLDKIIILCDSDEDDNSSIADFGMPYIGDDIIDMISRIGVQINIAINNSVSRKVHELYKRIINDLAESDDVNNIYETICKEIISIFPETRGYSQVDLSDIHVQLLYFITPEQLRVIGSTEKEHVGGSVYLDSSISGSLFKLQKKENLPKGYKDEYYKNKRYIYFIGDPRYGKNYKRTIGEITKSELAIPLFLSDNSPVGVINIESSKSNYFRETHARSLIYLGNSVAELVYNVYQLSQRKRESSKEMMRTLTQYVNDSVREFDHQINQPLQRIVSLSNKIEKGAALDSQQVVSRLLSIHKCVANAQKMLSTSLRAFSTSKSSINLENTINEVRMLFAEIIHTEEIEFSINIDPSINRIKLDNVFVQYLHDLIRNSFDAISRKKIKLIRENKVKSYTPKIEITAKLVDEFGLDNTSHENCNNNRCLIKILDNGIGISNEKIPLLGKKNFTDGKKYGTGRGLYSFQQYLAFHNARVVKYKSEKNNFFSISFIVDVTRD